MHLVANCQSCRANVVANAMASAFDELSDAFTVGGYKVGSLIARLTPAPLSQGAVALLAPGVALSLRNKRHMIERHLKRVTPSLSSLALRRASQQAFDSYMRYYTESFRLPSLSKKYVDNHLSVDGFHHIETALEKAKASSWRCRILVAGNGLVVGWPIGGIT